MPPGGGGKGEGYPEDPIAYPYPPLMDRETLGESLLLDGLHPSSKRTEKQSFQSLALKTRLRGSWGINSKNSRALEMGYCFYSETQEEGGEFVDESSP